MNQTLETIIEQELARKISVTQNGERVTLTYLEAMLRRGIQDCVQGSPAERRLMLKLIAEYLPQESAADVPRGPVIYAAPGDEDI